MSIWILGIHDGHNCGATLICDGAVIASVNEERLSRTKNDVGYPRRSIEDVLAIGGIDASELSAVVYASNFMHARSHLDDISRWYPVGMKEQRADASRPKDYAQQMLGIRRDERIDDVVDHLGIAPGQVSFVEHHLAHLTAAYYTAPNIKPGQRALGLTSDGAGDNLCATVSICEGSTASPRPTATPRSARSSRASPT
jgi:carbamoyltransferase